MSTGVAQQIEATYPLVPMQAGMCFHSLYAPGEGVYIQQIVCALPEELDPVAFGHAWQQVLQHYAVLRTAFRLDDPKAALQVVYHQAALPLAAHDWRQLSAEARETQLRAFLSADRRCGFELASAPLFRLALFRFADDDYRCVWTFHHALLDGRSFFLVLRDVFALYDARDTHRGATSASPPFRAFVELLQHTASSAAESFWRGQLRDFEAPTTLSVERSAPLAADEARYGVQQIELPPEQSAALQDLARSQQLTVNTLIQGAWALLLSRYGDAEDVVFGATRSGRRSLLTREAAQAMVGLLITTVPVRTRVTPEQQLLPWLESLRDQWVAMRPYEHTPLTLIQAWSSVPPGTALFESLVIYEHQTLEAALRAQGGPASRRGFTVLRQVNYPLTLAAFGGPPLVLRIEYDRRRFDDAFITRLLSQVQTLLEAFVRTPTARLADLPLLSEAERFQIIRSFNTTHAAYPTDSCLHQLIEQQALRTPGALAVIDTGTVAGPAADGPPALSYAELNTRANRLANYLSRRGVGPGAMVALVLDRSPELIVSLLAILKAGGAFLPLDPTYPPERLAYMLQHAQPPLIIAEHRFRAAPWLARAIADLNASVVELEADGPEIARQPDTRPDCAASPEGLAYVIYTSGSTGRPKGTLLPHRGLVNLSAVQARSFQLGVGDRVLQFASFSFDAAVWELVMALTSGATLVLSRHETLASPPELHRLLRAMRITAATLPPAVLEVLPDAELPDLRLLIAAGEQCPRSLVVRWAAGRRMFNAYGPTEATICASMHLCDQADQRDPPIGRALDNVQLYILDRMGQPAPLGAPGELHIGGAGLALGYLNQPALTAERFVSLPPFDPASDIPLRLYKTGDRARFRPDGTIDFLGRLDQQVKIRGYRVEPGEVAAVLRRHTAVREAAVVARADQPGTARLVAYVVPANQGAGAGQLVPTLRTFLADQLPAYMQPAAIVTLAALPLTPSGKLDQRALPQPDRAALLPDRAYVGPRTPTEQAIAAVWSDVLRVERIGVHDDYFSLGGHSLLAARIAFQLRTALDVEIPLRAMLEQGTVAQLAAYVDTIRWATRVHMPETDDNHEQGEL